MCTYYVAGIPYSDELYHHGIKGQKWGIRRYQNEDGSLTQAGQRHRGMFGLFHPKTASPSTNSSENKQSDKSKKMKTALKVGAAIAGAGLLAYGAYKANEFLGDKYRSKLYEYGKHAIEDLEFNRRQSLYSARSRRERKAINASHDKERERILDALAANKSNKAMWKNIGGTIKEQVSKKLSKNPFDGYKPEVIERVGKRR